MLFVPLGAALCFPWSSDPHDDPRRGWAGCARGGRAVARPRARDSSVDDLLLNTLGALLGHLLVAAWLRSRPPTPSAEEVRTGS